MKIKKARKRAIDSYIKEVADPRDFIILREESPIQSIYHWQIVAIVLLSGEPFYTKQKTKKVNTQ